MSIADGSVAARPSAGHRPTGIEFELETFEFVRASASTALVRVCGRWRADGSWSPPLPLLTVVSRGRRHRLQPVAGTPAPRAALTPRPWAGGFAAPVELVESGDAWTIEVGAKFTFALPGLRERGTGIDPLPPQAPASAGNGRPSDLELARRAAAQERALTNKLHEELQATSARAARLAIELAKARAEAATQAAAADAERAQVSEMLEGVQRVVTTQESDLDALRRAVARRERELTDSESRASRAVDESEALQSRLQAAEDAATAATLDADQARLRSDEAAGRADEAADGHETWRQKAKLLRSSLQEAEERASKLTAEGRDLENNLAKTREDAERRTWVLAEAQEQLADQLKAAEAQAASEREASSRRVSELEVTVATERARATSLERSLQEAEQLASAERDTAERELAESQTRIEEAERRHRAAAGEASRQLDKTRAHIEAEQEHASVLEDRLATLGRELVDERESAAEQLAEALSDRDEARRRVKARERALVEEEDLARSVAERDQEVVIRAEAAEGELAKSRRAAEEAQEQAQAVEQAHDKLVSRLEAAQAEAKAEREDAARRVMDLESAYEAGQARIAELEDRRNSLERELAQAREKSKAAAKTAARKLAARRGEAKAAHERVIALKRDLADAVEEHRRRREAAGERERADQQRVAGLECEAEEARRAREETRAELARISAAHDTALARNRKVEGLLVVAQQRAHELQVDWELEVGMDPERVEELEREAEAARRDGRQAQAELARVSAAHETVLARNRAIEGLLLLADQRARKLEVGWELELQERLVVARKVAATREANRVRKATERRLAERQAGARQSAQRIQALDQALAQALVEERELVAELEPKGERADRAREAPAEPARQSGGDPVRDLEAAPQRA